MAIFNIWPKTLKAALVLLLTGLSLSSPATAQTYADDWWGYVIRNNLGTFTLGQDLDFSCLAGRGEVLVAVAIEADAAQTKIELRHGKHSYRANAKRRVDGAYIFAVPQHRTAALYQLLTEAVLLPRAQHGTNRDHHQRHRKPALLSGRSRSV